MDIIEFRHNPTLLGGRPHMARPELQWAWDANLKALYGLPLNDRELELFRACTALEGPRAGGYPELADITGRQSGKTTTAGDVVTYEAATAPADGSADGQVAALVAQDTRGSIRTAFKYICDNFKRVPFLARKVKTSTADTLVLKNGVTVAVYPCRPAALRGIRCRVAVADELAHYRSSDGNPTDTEMLRALRPALATTGGKLLILSSPYSQTGALWELHRQHFGRESETLIWQASAPVMHPGLPADYLARMERDDPEAYRSEVAGEFRAGLATLLDPSALEAVTAEWREQMPREGVTYYVGADLSGGQRDASCAAAAFREGNHVTVAAVRRWPAPHNPDDVMRELVEFAESYNGAHRRIVADRYAAQFPQRSAERFGGTLVSSDLDKSALALELVPRVNSGGITIPNDPVTLRELRGWERKRGHAGKDRVDHRPGAHDDAATALALAAYLAGSEDELVAAVPDISLTRLSPWDDSAASYGDELW